MYHFTKLKQMTEKIANILDPPTTSIVVSINPSSVPLYLKIPTKNNDAIEAKNIPVKALTKRLFTSIILSGGKSTSVSLVYLSKFNVFPINPAMMPRRNVIDPTALVQGWGTK